MTQKEKQLVYSILVDLKEKIEEANAISLLNLEEEVKEAVEIFSKEM